MKPNKRKVKYTSNDVDFWLQWMRVHKQIAPDDPVMYAWLPGTMSIEELLAIRVAAEKMGAEVKINRRGAGEVVLLSRTKEKA
jgi:hypothetical protein